MKDLSDWILFTLVAVFSGFGSWVVSYLKEKGKNYATKEDFIRLKEQLSESTTLIEGIKTELSDKSWITQRVWVKKQEAYEAIFERLFDVKRYVKYQQAKYEGWFSVYRDSPYMHAWGTGDDNATLFKLIKEDQDEYEKVTQSPKAIKANKDLKEKHEKALEYLLQIIEVKSIYLDKKVETTIIKLKDELLANHEELDEDYDTSFQRWTDETNKAITEIEAISRNELKI